MLKNLCYALLLTVFLLAPALITSTILATQFNATLLDCRPLPGVMGRCDEMHYWNEIDCFDRVGLNGGYFIVDERPARAPWSHFGPHGPAFPAIYGALARVFGWHNSSAPLFNTGWLIVGSAAWLLLVRPSIKQLSAAIVLMATFWPCLLYLPATLQESFHCAVAFILAGLAHRRINEDSSSPWPFVIVCALASLVRITWAFMLIPWVVLAMNRSNKFARIAVLAGVPLLIAIWQMIAAPYPNALETYFSLIRQNPLEAGVEYSSHLGTNLSGMFGAFLQPLSMFYPASLKLPNPTSLDLPLKMTERYQVFLLLAIGLLIALSLSPSTNRFGAVLICTLVAMLVIRADMELIAALALGIWGCWPRQPRQSRYYVRLIASAALIGVLAVLQEDVVLRMFLGRVRLSATYLMILLTLCFIFRQPIARVLLPLIKQCVPDQPECRPYLFGALNLALITLIVIGLYDVKYDRDFRVLAPHLLLSILILLSGTGYRLGIALIAVGLLAAPVFDICFCEKHGGRFVTEPEIDLCPYLIYDPNRSAWDNTLLVSDVTLQTMIRVPPGFGVSTIVENENTWFDGIERTRVQSNLRSRYLLITHKEAPAWKDCDLKLLHESVHGNLYLNPNASGG